MSSKRTLVLGRYDYASYMAFTMYALCSLLVPMLLVTMAQDLGFPLDAGGMTASGGLHMVRSLAILLMLLSCGVMAGKIGKRLTMGSSMLLMGLGILLCALVPSYWVLVGCLMMAGLGEGLCEGIATPFIQDLHEDEPERYVNMGHAFWSVGVAMSVLVGGGLLALGVPWRVIMGGVGIVTLLVSAAFLWKEHPSHAYPERGGHVSPVKIWADTVAIAKVPQFWICCLAMFVGAGAEFGLTFWSAPYIALTFDAGPWISGLGTGAIALGMFIGRSMFGYFAKPHYLRWILLGASLGSIPFSLLLLPLRAGMMSPWLLFALVFVLLILCGVGVAPFWPTMQVYGVGKMPQLDSTLLYIYFSAMGIPGCGFFTWLMGFIGDKYGIQRTLMVVPASLILYSLIIWGECWYLDGRRRKKAMDHGSTLR